ncbi:MAG: hypothetical protein IJV41_00645 [Oscillospiraceae bacterium]|nr:hypothetical protein [Oscillospiraceae bacterium]
MDEVLRITKEEWDDLQRALVDMRARSEQAESDAAVQRQLREDLTKELGKLQSRCAKLLVQAGKSANLPVLEARLQYLLQSDIVRLYDEVNPSTGKHRFNLAGLDACMLYAFDRTFGGD